MYNLLIGLGRRIAISQARSWVIGETYESIFNPNRENKIEKFLKEKNLEELFLSLKTESSTLVGGVDMSFSEFKNILASLEKGKYSSFIKTLVSFKVTQELPFKAVTFHPLKTSDLDDFADTTSDLITILEGLAYRTKLVSQYKIAHSALAKVGAELPELIDKEFLTKAKIGDFLTYPMGFVSSFHREVQVSMRLREWIYRVRKTKKDPEDVKLAFPYHLFTASSVCQFKKVTAKDNSVLIGSPVQKNSSFTYFTDAPGKKDPLKQGSGSIHGLAKNRRSPEISIPKEYLGFYDEVDYVETEVILFFVSILALSLKMKEVKTSTKIKIKI